MYFNAVLIATTDINFYSNCWHTSLPLLTRKYKILIYAALS